jgi:hypothetical protein
MLLHDYSPALKYGAKILPSEIVSPMAVGNVWYVNGCNEGGFADGNDDNIGNEIDHPFATIKKALTMCTNYHNDYIVILDYWQPTGEDWPIEINKDTVNIVSLQTMAGFPMGGPMIPWAIIYASGSHAAFYVNANNVFVQGLQIYAGTTGYACVTFGNKGFIQFDKCRFDQGTYGFHSVSPYEVDVGLSVTDCFFQNGLASGGIYLNSDPAHCYIAHNHFDRLAGIAIRVAGGSGTVIEDNVIACASETSGLGITLSGGTARCTVAHNFAGYGVETDGTVPYRDLSTSTNNAWIANYYGASLVTPATV